MINGGRIANVISMQVTESSTLYGRVVIEGRFSRVVETRTVLVH